MFPRYIKNNNGDNEYPAWQLAAFLIKLLRNLAPSQEEDLLLGMESKLVRHFQKELGDKMKKMGKKLDQSTDGTTDGAAEEAMLALGHSCCSAV